jgi:hypothetical protein
MLSMARFRLRSHSLWGGGTWQTSRIGLVWWQHTTSSVCYVYVVFHREQDTTHVRCSVDCEAHLLLKCPATAVVWLEYRFSHLPFNMSQDRVCSSAV